MWQDGVALLIVIITVLALLRPYVLRRVVRFGGRRSGNDAVNSATHPNGCGGCGSGSSCAKATLKASSAIIAQHRPSPSSNRS